MKKFEIFLIFCLCSILQLFSSEPSHADCSIVSPKKVKCLNLNHKILSNTERISHQASTSPKIHKGFWPHFCLAHLQNDPEGCSAWSDDGKGNLELDFALFGSSDAYFDRTLISQVSHQIDLIPRRVKGYKSRCYHTFCKKCGQTVALGAYSVEDEDNEGEYIYYVLHQCKCCDEYWLNWEGGVSGEECDIVENWRRCRALTIFPGYFDWHHQTYFPFFKHYLTYLEENPQCSCYWPQVNEKTKSISDSVYYSLLDQLQLTQLEQIRETFSPYLKDRTQFGFLSGILTHAFFYSQYRKILIDLDDHCIPTSDYPLIHQNLISTQQNIQKPFLALYNECLAKHPHPKIYYERGMVLFHEGKNIDSIEDIKKFISYAEENNYEEFLTSELYLQEGKLFSELLSYDEAIKALTKAISKDKANKEAYFERAIAYFETGNFEKALSDYLASGIQPEKVNPKKIGQIDYLAFGKGMTTGILKGGYDGTVEFVPSLLSSFRGLSRGVWTCVSSPVQVSKDMVNCANACLEFIKDNSTKEIIGKIVPELQECLNKWNELDDQTKGHYIGYVIGKYGIDIFIGSGSLKAIQLYRNLRRANAIMTLETAALSPKNAKEILSQCAKEWKVREDLLKNGNLKIQWDKQGKHIPGHKNYVAETNKSIFEHKNPQKLIEQYAGSGKKFGSEIPGKPGYKEDINFHEFIGYSVNERTGEKTATTWGRIHYAKDGAHIVPIKKRE